MCSRLGVGTARARIRWPGGQYQRQVKSHQSDRIRPHSDEEYATIVCRLLDVTALTQRLTVPLIIINTLIIVYELILG